MDISGEHIGATPQRSANDNARAPFLPSVDQAMIGLLAALADGRTLLQAAAKADTSL